MNPIVRRAAVREARRRSLRLLAQRRAQPRTAAVPARPARPATRRPAGEPRA